MIKILNVFLIFSYFYGSFFYARRDSLNSTIGDALIAYVTVVLELSGSIP